MDGTIEKVESDPCKYTTGKAIIGTRLTVKTKEKLVNIHLETTSDVSKFNFVF